MNTITRKNLINALEALANPQKARDLARFFKTGAGEYGAGDKFLGIMVPLQREVAKKYQHLKLEDIQVILQSEFHEFRLTGLLILVAKFEKGDAKTQKAIYKFYLKNLKHINNWDLVDVTTPKIVGAYLADKPLERKILYTLAKSKDLWKKRVAIVATAAFIRKNDFADTLKISQILLTDKHDLIHKAVGWMLREVGKKNQKIEELFLQKHYLKMPRTMLRYAIEKFEEKKRKSYLRKK